MKALKVGAAALLGLAVAGCGGDGGGNATAQKDFKMEQVAAPNGGDWAQIVAETPEGGFRIGNPEARVKVVEYGSLTCPHCAEFAEKGEPHLVEKYVKSGQVSFEFRNYVRDSGDLAASLIARCNGPNAFFPMTQQLFASQEEWIGKLQKMPAEQQAQIQSMSAAQVVPMFAQAAGLLDFARVRGIPMAKAQACVSDAAQIQRLVEMGQKAGDIPGTPTFLINGNIVPNTAAWSSLEPAVQQALK